MIGNRIRRERKNLGLSQKDLGRMIGITSQQVSKYELERNSPNFSMLNKFSKALGVNSKEFCRIAINDDLYDQIESLKHIRLRNEGKMSQLRATILEKDDEIDTLQYWQREALKPWYRRVFG